jgi:hypothetical protein
MYGVHEPRNDRRMMPPDKESVDILAACAAIPWTALDPRFCGPDPSPPCPGIRARERRVSVKTAAVGCHLFQCGRLQDPTAVAQELKFARALQEDGLVQFHTFVAKSRRL